MKPIVAVCLAILFSLVLTACSEPTIDASSEDAIERSVDQVTADMSPTEEDAFNKAIADIAMTGAWKAIGSGDTNQALTSMFKPLDGKTASEVIAMHQERIAERRERERTQALQELEELEEKRRQTETHQQQLAAFEVVRSRFYLRERDILGDQPVLELHVQNGTDHPISRAYFEGTVASPDLAVPWIEEDFNYSIPGGLEPGEEAQWNLKPNLYGDWGRVEVPGDAVFTAVPVRLDGPGGEPLFDATRFSDRDERRLEKLKAQYGDS